MKWKIYFWIYTVLSAIGLIVIAPYFSRLNFASYEGIAESVLLVIATFSYTYKKKIGSSVFWRFLFVILVIIWMIQIGVKIIPSGDAISGFVETNISNSLGEILFSMFIAIPALIAVYRIGKEKVDTVTA